MSTVLFSAAQKPPRLVNREKELEIIQKAIYQPETSCQIVFIRGQGGMGKSRLAEEVLWRGGNWRMRQPENRGPIPADHPDWDWTRDGTAVVGDMIDLSATHLQARAPFLHAVRDALIWPESSVNFTRYDAAYERFQSQRVYPADFAFLQKLGQEAEARFLDDYRVSAEKNRLVLVLDTVEKLYPLGGTELLYQEGLLTEEDMVFYTYQWLLTQIRAGGLPNTTLILVGRGEEGKAFFEAVTQAANQNPTCKVTPLDELEAFTLEDTCSYFQMLAEDLREQARQKPELEALRATLTSIVDSRDRLETLWIYTGGQPVRLALYTDLIFEDQKIPERLQENPEQAKRVQASAEGLDKARKEIEAGFIRLLFGRRELHAEILQALVRAPRGLGVEQLHYCLGSQPKELPQAWSLRSQQEDDPRELQKQIEKSLSDLRRLAIIKIRSDGRIGLQDEVYRIYNHALSSDESTRQAEREARQRLYAKLENWARYQLESKQQELIQLQARDERQLRFERPSLALDVHFAPLPKREQEERARLRAEIQQWELESLHYALLRDFTRNFNHELFELADRRWIAYDEDAGAIIQAELWQVLEDPAYALEDLGTLIAWKSLERRQETALSAFERIALQNDICSWIKRFGLRQEYRRAIEFAEQLEAAIEKWTQERADETAFLRTSWLHTFARRERALWRDYARLMSGQEIAATLERMITNVKELERFLEYSDDEFAFPERQERGFRGHPAESKMQRLTALYYNYIGYGYANLGLFSKAREAYGKTLRYLREVSLPHMEPTTRNNLSRVLSERGHTRARRLCLDALELRKKQASEVPIAYSYNTLALIDNDHLRSDLAWIEAAIAIAYFRRAENARGLGLALLQLDEALRRLARQKSEVYHLRGDSPEVVLETAERAVDEAISLFTEGPAAGERLRLVEAWIEKGSLERDWIRFTEEASAKERHHRDALYYYAQAADLAHQLGNQRLELDAKVNMAWTHYYFGNFDQAEEALSQAEKFLPNDCWFKPGEPLPQPERDDVYVYQQLSKMYGLRGRLALERFDRQAKEISQKETDREKRRMRIHEDSTAQGHLRQAAEAYVLSLGYSQLISPRSSALIVIYDSLYEYLKGFNLTELEDFYNYARQAQNTYRTEKIQLVGLGKLDEFMRDSFGSGKEGL